MTELGNNYISVMGFLYSGSSAVYDFIRQFDGNGYTANDESRIFINGITELFNLKKQNKNPSAEQIKKIKKRFRCSNDDGLFEHINNYKRNKDMFVGIDIEKSGKLVDEYLKSIEGADISNFIFLTGVFIDGFCKLKSDSKRIVLNNDPGASLIETTLLFPNNKAIVVYRNPLDQYVDQIRHKTHYYTKNGGTADIGEDSAKKFVEMLNLKIDLFYSGIDFIIENRQ
jgi:hypothetical protein